MRQQSLSSSNVPDTVPSKPPTTQLDGRATICLVTVPTSSNPIPDPDAPIPTATTFSASCSPAAALNTTHITLGGSAATSTVGSTVVSTTVSSISSVALTQTSITYKCNRYYTVQSGDSCQGIVDKCNEKFTLSDFYTWNPAVGSDCSSLWVGYTVCVGIPSPPTSSLATSSIAPSSTSSSTPMQTGIVSNFDRYYTVHSRDSCQVILDKYRGEFTLSDFYSWNPSRCWRKIQHDGTSIPMLEILTLE